MAIVDLVMPKLGESIMEATILKWHKQSGDPVQMDETVLEIATDKVDSEVPSTAEGIIEETFFQVNDVVPIGTVIAKIKTSSDDQASATGPRVGAPDTNYKMHEPISSGDNETSQVVSTVTNSATRSVINGNRLYSPLVLNIAASEGVSMNELEKIPGTGNDGRVTKKDILQYVEERKSGNGYTKAEVVSQPQSYEPPAQKQYSPPVYSTGNVEIIELDRMRRMISKHMVESVHTSAHVTSFAEADVTNMVLWRDRVKKEFEKRE